MLFILSQHMLEYPMLLPIGPLVGILKQFWVMIVKLLYVESGYNISTALNHYNLPIVRLVLER